MILFTPKEGQGFLVLRKIIENNYVDHWAVSILEKQMQSDSTYTYTKFLKENLFDKNYLEIADSIYNSENYVLIVEAFDADRSLIGTSEDVIMVPPNHHPYQLKQRWRCNGIYYAYEIKEMHSTYFGNSIISIDETGTGYSNNPYYYQYTGNLQAADIIKQYHHPYTSYTWGDNAQFIQLTNTTNVTYSTASGVPITSANVYGVAKSLGPWKGAEGLYLGGYTTPTYFTNDFTNYDLNQMVAFFNANGGSTLLNNEGLPPLECLVAIEVIGTGGNLGSTVELDYDCLENTGFQLGGPDENDMFDFISILESCAPDWDIFGYITARVINVSDTNQNIVVDIPYDGFKDENGNIIAPTFNTPRGLYMMQIETKAGQYAYFMIEAKEEINNALLQKDFVSVSAFPVPIVSQTEFNLHLEATANVKFTYYLLDFDGNLIHSEVFNLPQGHNRDHLISLNENEFIPEGILINRLEFADGSVIAFQTVRN
jgi:hypothetical protein